jgi:aquaporin Z
VSPTDQPGCWGTLRRGVQRLGPYDGALGASRGNNIATAFGLVVPPVGSAAWTARDAGIPTGFSVYSQGLNISLGAGRGVDMATAEQVPSLGPLARYEQEVVERIQDFNDPRQEWRRLFSEVLGTFFLVLVAAGGGMMGHAFPGVISRTAAVVAPALMVMAIILFMGKISGAHLNPAVSIAFALRRDFPWWRVPGYIVAQLGGAILAALFLHAVINVSAMYGSNYPAHGYSDIAAFWMELILTAGLVSVILGTASGAQNIGIIGAFGVGGYIALAGLWGSPISGASMNPARTFGPDLVSTTFTGYWVYIAGPIAGASLAVVIAFILRGRGGGKSGSGAAQGDLFTHMYEEGKS